MADEQFAEPEHITVASIDIDGSQAELTAPLKVNIEFDANPPEGDVFPNAHWEITFTADQVNKRKIIRLGETQPTNMAAGPQSMNFQVDAIDVSSIANHVLANVGLISAKLLAYDPPQELVQVGMVTQVTEDNGVLLRHIFNPME